MKTTIKSTKSNVISKGDSKVSTKVKFDFTHMPAVDSCMSRVSVKDGILSISGKLDGPTAAVLCEKYAGDAVTGRQNGLQVLYTVFDQNGRDKSSEPVRYVTDYLSRTRAGQSLLGLQQSAFSIVPALVDAGVPLSLALPKADFVRNVSAVLLTDAKPGEVRKVAKSAAAKNIVSVLKAGGTQAEIKAAAGRARKPALASLASASKAPVLSLAETIRRTFDSMVEHNLSLDQYLVELNKVASVKVSRTFKLA